MKAKHFFSALIAFGVISSDCAISDHWYSCSYTYDRVTGYTNGLCSAPITTGPFRDTILVQAPDQASAGPATSEAVWTDYGGNRIHVICEPFNPTFGCVDKGTGFMPNMPPIRIMGGAGGGAGGSLPSCISGVGGSDPGTGVGGGQPCTGGQPGDTCTTGADCCSSLCEMSSTGLVCFGG